MSSIPKVNIPYQTLKRLPGYLQYLKSLDADETLSVSATMLAKALGLNDVQVRKDLASISTNGRPRVGYELGILIKDLENALGLGDLGDAVLVGAGKLGQALLSYKSFQSYGLNIVAAFDSAPELEGIRFSEKPVFSLDKLENICHRMHIKIGIITVPAESAQDICDRLIAAGIRAVWNFAPVHLRTSDGIFVQNENMATSLVMMSNYLKKEKITI